jgi:hypothetical protein
MPAEDALTSDERVTAVTAPKRALRQISISVAEWSAALQLEIEMHSADNAADVRLLSDAELNDVNGGYLAAIVAAGAWAALVIGGWDNGSIYTKEQQAAALGLSHLL